MTKHIKKTSELPAWFSLEKYEMAENLDAAGWYAQLSIRSRCLSFLSQGHNISEILGLIREEPIIDVVKPGFLSFHYHRGMFYEQPVIAQSMHGVHSLTVHELYMTEINIEESERIQAKAFFERVERTFRAPPEDLEESSSIENPDFLYEPVHQVSSKPRVNALLGVNLMLPDKELVEQFKAYLPVLREECDAEFFSKKWHRPDFDDLVEFGVLPYLDLIIWEKERDVEILQKVMEEALFSSYDGSEDRVRKTTAPKAKKLISKESLAFLRVHASFDQEKQ